MDKVEITICLGSSCFSRGNKMTLRVIDEFLKENHLKEQVHFRGNHCFGHCEEGPVLKINEQEYTNVTADKALQALKANFNLE